MIDFRNDYSQGAAPQVLDYLIKLGDRSFRGYGEDELCRAAKNRLREMVGMQRAALHFVSGGTQANLIVLAAMLRPHQGVIAADTGHISVHEAGAIEATGHKVLALPHREGKLDPLGIQRLVDSHIADESFEHMVQPRAVYLSNATELGTVYTKDELRAISQVCRRKGLLLYLDGARLGYAMASEACDLTLPDIAGCCDAFSIGLTKQGALFGEAIVIINTSLQKDFRYLIKQRGAMLAKGWLMGAQFEALFEGDLYWQLSRHALALAGRLKEGLSKLGVPFLADSPTNQLFPIFDEEVIERLAKDYGFNRIESLADGRAAIRFVTHWGSKAEDVEALIRDVGKALGR